VNRYIQPAEGQPVAVSFERCCATVIVAVTNPAADNRYVAEKLLVIPLSASALKASAVRLTSAFGLACTGPPSPTIIAVVATTASAKLDQRFTHAEWAGVPSLFVPKTTVPVSSDIIPSRSLNLR
jgi:hypothetical protein